ncbi:MAG: iron-sulfur cluster assembly scaffold protein [Desulfobacteraceae bacterium]|nr:MAG: iron-sulfur cluster assembly scaffold protein [Desulfobacteraceae bacterium]
MEKREFDFFKDHSERFLQMALSADRQEAISRPDGYGKNIGDCGDTVEIFLKVRNGCIEHASYRIEGCINTNACANAVVHMVEGKSVAAAWKITPDAVIEDLKTLPKESSHCAELAVGALYRALANHVELKKEPWKKGYPTR